MRRSTHTTVPCLIVAVVAYAGCGYQTTSEVDHDHGDNIVHTHTHVHDGEIGHDHDHSGKTTTHSHEHQHGHRHASNIEPSFEGQLVEIGHVHGSTTTLYFAEVVRHQSQLKLQFIADDGSKIRRGIKAKKFAAHLDFRGKAIQELEFCFVVDAYTADLPKDMAAADQPVVSITDLQLGDQLMNFQFPLPPSRLATEED